jgi:hypothetical protein
MGTCRLFVLIAITTIESDIIVPTERSIPPEMITSVMPIASTAFTEPCNPTVSRLAGRIKEGLMAVMTMTTTTSKITGPKVSTSFHICADRGVGAILFGTTTGTLGEFGAAEGVFMFGSVLTFNFGDFSS